MIRPAQIMKLVYNSRLCILHKNILCKIIFCMIHKTDCSIRVFRSFAKFSCKKFCAYKIYFTTKLEQIMFSLLSFNMCVEKYTVSAWSSSVIGNFQPTLLYTSMSCGTSLRHSCTIRDVQYISVL